MTPIILIDLDDTLLSNGMDTFIPAYMRGFAKALSPFTSPEIILSALQKSVQHMVGNQLPDRTLIDVFNQYFFSATSVPEKEGHEAIARFYDTDYRELQSLTQPRPEAVTLIENILHRGWKVVIATNPLFSQAGIYQRLEWAGLSPQKYPFQWITTIENSHFAKPNPAYYAEILAELGWPQTPVVMIGNDLENDVKPAHLLGLATFWVDPDPDTTFASPKGKNTPSQGGSLREAWNWLKEDAIQSFKPTYAAGPSAAAVLQATPTALLPSLQRIPEALWERRTADGEWTLAEILCHMRDVERGANLPRLTAVLTEDNPFLTGIDTNQWASDDENNGQAGLGALHDYIQYRMESLKIITQLTDKDWGRPARHAIFGPTTLLETIIFMANHDRVHIRQIRKVISGET